MQTEATSDLDRSDHALIGTWLVLIAVLVFVIGSFLRFIGSDSPGAAGVWRTTLVGELVGPIHTALSHLHALLFIYGGASVLAIASAIGLRRDGRTSIHPVLAVGVAVWSAIWVVLILDFYGALADRLLFGFWVLLASIALAVTGAVIDHLREGRPGNRDMGCSPLYVDSMGRYPDVTIEPLGAHPELVTTTVTWHMAEFDPDGDAARWIRARTEEARLAGVPCAWVAFADEVAVGSVSLVEHNMDSRRDLTPWLAALFVLQSHRGRGIGTALVRHCEEAAWGFGVDRLYLYTAVAEGFYERLGWATLGREEYEGSMETVMLRERPSSS